MCTSATAQTKKRPRPRPRKWTETKPSDSPRFLERQLQQLQQEARRSDAANAEQAAVVQPQAWTPVDDLWLEFDAGPELVPKIAVPIPKHIEEALQTSASLFSAIPWGAQLPALTFGQLGVQPHMVHTLTGGAMWEQCWGERQARINDLNYLPYRLINVLRWIADQAKPLLNAAAKESWQKMLNSIESATKERRQRGAPY